MLILLLGGDILIPITFLFILFPRESSLLIVSGFTDIKTSLLFLKIDNSIISFEEVLINEHIRYPHEYSDIEDIVNAIDKMIGD